MPSGFGDLTGGSALERDHLQGRGQVLGGGQASGYADGETTGEGHVLREDEGSQTPSIGGSEFVDGFIGSSG